MSTTSLRSTSGTRAIRLTQPPKILQEYRLKNFGLNCVGGSPSTEAGYALNPVKPTSLDVNPKPSTLNPKN